MKIFVGASSSENIPLEYKDDCGKLLEILLKDNDLVFGAYNKGLMGISYEIAKKNKRLVTGICPEAYKSGLNLLECDNAEITNSILDSTMKIYKNSDVIVLLPGGFGSIYEFFTANYCKICNEIDVPIILYNSCGYYDKLISFIEDICGQKFVKETEMDKYVIANNADEVILYLNDFEQKHKKRKAM